MTNNLAVNGNNGTIRLPDAPLLLYDGTCGFCARSVQLVLTAERNRTDMLFATLAGPYGELVRALFPAIASADSILLVRPSREGKGAPVVLARSAAAIEIARYLGGLWKFAAGLAYAVPRPLRDWMYDLIARHRHAIAGTACLVPTPRQRQRFIDFSSAGPTPLNAQ